MGKLVVVVGGQFGSEGKGAVVAHLARSEARPLMGVRVGGPNAGHTAYDDSGARWALRQVPVPAVSRPGSLNVIAAGSVIDTVVLHEEVEAIRKAHGLALLVDSQATVMLQGANRYEEQLVSRVGSTGKGIGYARAQRIMREAPLAADLNEPGVVLENTAARMRDWLAGDGCVVIEGTQGFGLGLHAGWYPYCTSHDCRAIDVLAQAGVNPWDPVVSEFEIWIVMRTFPIRVAGPSGPLHDETTWEELAAETGGYIQPERTTVTQKVRRVGRWDQRLAEAAVGANGGSRIFDVPKVSVALTMFDYRHPDLRDATDIPDAKLTWVRHLEHSLGVPIPLIGTGPSTIVDRR